MRSPAVAVVVAAALAVALQACSIDTSSGSSDSTTAAEVTTTTPSGATATVTGATTTTPTTTTTSPTQTTTSPTTATVTAPSGASVTATSPTTTTSTTATTDAEAILNGEPVAGSAPSAGTTTTRTFGQPAAPLAVPTITRFFSTSSPWNTPVERVRVDPKSTEMLKQATIRTAATETPDGTLKPIRRHIGVGLTVNVKRWTVPIFSDRGGVPTPASCRQTHCGHDAVTSVTLAPGDAPNPSYDGWMTVVDTTARVARDFWRARRERDGSISYQFIKTWNLDGPGFQAPGGVSARGSGLPLFAGVIRPEEVRSGHIDHALSISVPGAASLRYVQPASVTDGNGARSSLPEGARLRLRPGAAKLLTHKFVRSRRERRSAEVIINALERYGAIVVDRAAAPTLYAQRNARWHGILPLNLLQNVKLRQFEVLRLPKVLNINRREKASPATAPTGSPGVSPASNTIVPGPATSTPAGASGVEGTTTTTTAP